MSGAYRGRAGSRGSDASLDSVDQRWVYEVESTKERSPEFRVDSLDRSDTMVEVVPSPTTVDTKMDEDESAITSIVSVKMWTELNQRLMEQQKQIVRLKSHNEELQRGLKEQSDINQPRVSSSKKNKEDDHCQLFNMQDRRLEKYRENLTRLYQKYHPEKMERIPQMCREYRQRWLNKTNDENDQSATMKQGIIDESVLSCSSSSSSDSDSTSPVPSEPIHPYKNEHKNVSRVSSDLSFGKEAVASRDDAWVKDESKHDSKEDRFAQSSDSKYHKSKPRVEFATWDSFTWMMSDDDSNNKYNTNSVGGRRRIKRAKSAGHKVMTGSFDGTSIDRDQSWGSSNQSSNEVKSPPMITSQSFTFEKPKKDPMLTKNTQSTRKLRTSKSWISSANGW